MNGRMTDVFCAFDIVVGRNVEKQTEWWCWKGRESLVKWNETTVRKSDSMQREGEIEWNAHLHVSKGMEVRCVHYRSLDHALTSDSEQS